MVQPRLGEVLELIHSSPRRFRTARAVGRTGDERWRFWWAGDARWRFERDCPGGVQVEVRAGPTWWTVDPGGQAHTNDGEPGLRLGMPGEFGLLHPRSLLGCAVLEVLREERVAGRAAVVLRAAPRPGTGASRWWFFEERSEPIEVAIDLERGAALAGPWCRVEEIAFDEPLAPGLFSRPYPEDLPVHRHPVRPLEVPLEEARRRVGFPVVLPGSLPRGARLLRCSMDPGERPGWVGLSWAVDPGHRYVLHLRQGPQVAREAAGVRGREVVRGDARILVEEEGTRWRRVLAERAGRWYELQTDLPVEVALAVAASLGEEP